MRVGEVNGWPAPSGDPGQHSDEDVDALDDLGVGTGEALVRRLAERYAARGRDHLDLSVLHSNTGAIRLYRKLGFLPASPLCVKRKNPINTPLFAARPPGLEQVNPYALIIAEEALRRGIRVEVTDAEWGELVTVVVEARSTPLTSSRLFLMITSMAR